MPYSDALARSPVMSLQSSKEHKVNGMTARAVCSPSPQPSPSRETGSSVRVLFCGDPSAFGRGPRVHGTLSPIFLPADAYQTPPSPPSILLV